MGTMGIYLPKPRCAVKGGDIAQARYIGFMKWLIAVMLVFPLFAVAQEAERAAPKSNAELYPPLPGVDYYCTDSVGARVEIGGVTCITASCSMWTARCEMTSTNRMAIWRKTQEGCLGASTLDRLHALKPVG